jgi:hypothetical protein
MRIVKITVTNCRTSSLQRRDGGGLTAYERLFGRPSQHQLTGNQHHVEASSAVSGKKVPVFITKAGKRREKVKIFSISFSISNSISRFILYLFLDLK